MKKTLLSTLLAITICSAVAIAQPTLTAIGINPVIGEIYSIKEGASVSPGSSGANQTWTVIPTTSLAANNFTFISAAASPNASSFSQANICLDGVGYGYYNTTGSALQVCGSDGGVILSYSNPEDMLHFPFNMGNTYSDSWSVTYMSSSSYTRTGNTDVTYDGYGSLTLASGTYSNVVRVHYVQTYSDVYSGGSEHYVNDEYMWYLNGTHFPIASTYSLTGSSLSTPNTGSEIMSNISPTSIYDYDNIFSTITSFPNPAANEINFNINNIPMAAIDVTDISGKNIYSEKLTKNLFDNTIKINTSEFKDGIYFVKFTTEDGQIGAKKISILK